MDTGPQQIEDTSELAHVKRQARKVHMESLALAILLTVASALVPV